MLSGMELGGFALQGLGALFGGSGDVSKQQKKLFQQALKEIGKGRDISRGLMGQAVGANKAAQASLKAQNQRARRESIAGQMRAVTLARRSAQQQTQQALATNFGRGMMGSTIGLAARQAAARDIGLTGGMAAMQGAQQRQALASQLGSGLASLNQAQAGIFQSQAQQELQASQALANMMGQYQPIVDTGLSQLLGTMGGQLFGYGAADRLGFFNKG